jgi:thymidylate synthase (FAD)
VPKLVKASFQIETEIDGMKILREIERYARNCYKSEGKITEASCIPFIRSLLAIRPIPHLGILEHHYVTVRLIVDRGISHEEVRHRMAAYLQESTRYCDYGKAGEIKVIDIRGHMTLEQYTEWWAAMCDAEKHYNRLRELSCQPEIARSVLPNSLKTEVIDTKNLSSWRNFFIKRAVSKRAHPQMREVTIPLLKAFQAAIPVVFEDLVPEEAGTQHGVPAAA